MQRIQNEAISAIALRDYALVKSYFDQLGAPFYDQQTEKAIHGTPVIEITDKLAEFLVRSKKPLGNRFFLKEEYKNQFTESVKGRAVASMVLNAIESGVIYSSSGSKKRWIEPTSGNTGKGLAEIAKLLGVEFTAVLSRLDVSEEIQNSLLRSKAKIITIGSEYSVQDLETIAQEHHKSVHYYWTMIADIDEKGRSILLSAIRNAREPATSYNADGDQEVVGVDVKQVEGRLLIEPLLPLAVEASESPIIQRVEEGEFTQLKELLLTHIPELNDPNSIVAFLCNQGNSSMALNTLLSQLGFNNVCSVKGGIDALRAVDNEMMNKSDEFCPVPGTSIARSSIEFVKKVVSSNPEEYFTFMQYENIENVRAHMLTTGPELMEQIPDVDIVVCTFGTGGTATGLARYFRQHGVQVYVAFPKKPLEGIRTLKGADGLAFYRPELYSRAIEVENSESDEFLKYLLEKQVNVGPSTATALRAALDASVTENAKTFAVVAADGIENYESQYKVAP
jgi:cysteine synthase